MLQLIKKLMCSGLAGIAIAGCNELSVSETRVSQPITTLTEADKAHYYHLANKLVEFARFKKEKKDYYGYERDYKDAINFFIKIRAANELQQLYNLVTGKEFDFKMADFIWESCIRGGIYITPPTTQPKKF